jgi:hypothetical protein
LEYEGIDRDIQFFRKGIAFYDKEEKVPVVLELGALKIASTFGEDNRTVFVDLSKISPAVFEDKTWNGTT